MGNIFEWGGDRIQMSNLKINLEVKDLFQTGTLLRLFSHLVLVIIDDQSTSWPVEALHK